MKEYTITLDAEITFIGTYKDNETEAVNWGKTEKNLAEAIHADDVHITNGKVFISKEGVTE